MDTLNRLLDTATKTCSPPTQQALADRLNVSRQTLHDWRTGKKRITDEHLARVIDAAHGEAVDAVQVRREAASTRSERHLWETLARQLGAAATLAAVALFPVYEASAARTLTDAPVMHYAKTAVRAITRRVRDWLATWSRRNAPSLLAAR